MEKKSMDEEIKDIFTDEYLYKYRGQPYRIRSMIEGFVSGKEAEAREEGFKDGIELEQLLNAEFFEEDYQNPERVKKLKKKYNFKEDK